MYHSRPSNPYHSLIKRTGNPNYLQPVQEDFPENVEREIEENKYDKLVKEHKNEKTWLWVVLVLLIVLFILILLN